MNWDDTGLSSFKEDAHKLGLNQQQYNGILDSYINSTKRQIGEYRNAQATKQAEVEIKLKNEWGQNFGMNKELARKAAQHLFGEDGFAFVDQAFGNSESVIKGLYQLGRELNEDGLFGGDPGARLGGVTVEDAQAQITSIMKDKTNPLNAAYWSLSQNKEHQAAVAKVEELTKIVAGARR